MAAPSAVLGARERPALPHEVLLRYGTAQKALADARKKLDARSDALFAEKLRAVFYVGATGLLPDEVEAKALSAEVLARKYPELAFSKDEKEGTFFEVGDTIISVYAKAEYFSRDMP